MSAWSTLLPLLAPLHLYSSIGGVDIYIKMVLSKICRSQHLNLGLDYPMHGNAIYTPLFIFNLINQRNSAFWNFYFDLKYIPTLHFTYFLCSIALILGLEPLDNNKVTDPMMLLAVTMVLYTLTCFCLERRLQYKISIILNTRITLETINNTLTNNKSYEHTQYANLTQSKYDKIDKTLFPENYRIQRDIIFYRLHLTIVTILIWYCTQTSLIFVLTIYPYIALFFLPKTDWYIQKINSSFLLNRYVHLTAISMLFLCLFLGTDTLPYFPFSYFNTHIRTYYLIIFFLPYFLTPRIIQRKVQDFNKTINNYNNKPNTVVAQYLSQKMTEIQIKPSSPSLKR